MSTFLLIIISIPLVASGFLLVRKPNGRPFGFGLLGISLVLLLFTFGYHVGKNLAHRGTAYQSSYGLHGT
jgi:hypothetical protein